MVKQTHRNQPIKPEVWFESISVVDKTPENESVGDGEFIMVVYREKPIWALFRCPCGCGHVISLSLQNVHYPNWKVDKSLAGRPTLYPSVSQNNGCYSHFWIDDGRVHWCKKSAYLSHRNKSNL